MLKKILATALAAAMIFGLAATAFAAPVFPDTAGVANENVIARLKALGIVKGDDLGNFNPNDPINRAEFTTMVVRMLGLETAATYLSTPTAFPDVTTNHAWAYGYINIATGRGLIKGYEDGTFRPSNNVTQAEALTILVRALGYTDNLPGDWPVDYVMKGAELGIIADGFTGGAAATRALIASLVNNTLDENLVKEDKDAPGTYDDKYAAAPTTLYRDAFGLRESSVADAYVTGLCIDVDTDDTELTVRTKTSAGDVDVTKTYVTGVAIYGKDGIEDLEGQYVKATLNEDGEVIFITITTKQEVVGEITAVDTVNLKVTVGGTQYTVLSTAEVVKNGAKLTTTTAGALVSVKDANATLLLNSDGKVYRIVASLLDKEGTIASKSTSTDAAGKVINKVVIGSGTYNFTDDTTIVRNGSTAVYADLKVGDEVEFSVNVNDLVYIDAFSNVIEGYKVTNYVADTSGATITASKDGVESTFTVAKDSNGNLLVAVTDISLGNTYDLTLNKEGKVKDVELTTVSGPTTSKVKTVASKDTVYDSGQTRYEYRLNFTDGTVLNLSDTLFAATGSFRNGVPLSTAGDAVADALAIWTAAKPNDMFWLTGSSPNFAVELFAPSVSGQLVHALDDGDFKIYNSDGDLLADFTASFSTAVTQNGVTVPASTIGATSGVKVDSTRGADFLGTVTFATASPSVKPTVSTLTVESFNSTKSYPVSAISSNTTAYTYTLDDGDGAPYISVVANIKTTDSYEDAIVMKGGVKVTAADVAIGNRLMVAAPVGGGYTPYIKVLTDTTVPTVTAVQTVYAADAAPATTSSLTVSFKSNEPARKGYIWIGGTQYEAAFSGTVWTKTISGFTTMPAIATIAVTDYAGNVSSTIDVPISAGTYNFLVDATVTIDDSTLAVAGTGQITVVTDPVAPTGGYTVGYASSNTDVATVNATGLVTGVAAGSATITVTVSQGSFVILEFEIDVTVS